MGGEFFCGMYSSSRFGPHFHDRSHRPRGSSRHWSQGGFVVLRKSLFVISVVFAGVVLNQATAFASTDYTQLCVAAGHQRFESGALGRPVS